MNSVAELGGAQGEAIKISTSPGIPGRSETNIGLLNP